MSFDKVAEVILDRSLAKRLDYGVLASQSPLAKPGMLVEVPLRGQLCKGVIYAIKEQSACKKLLPIKAIIMRDEALPKDLFDLALWMSRYYCTPLSRVIRTLLPSAVRKEGRAKTQIAITLAKPKKTLRELCPRLREKHQAQGRVLDVLLQAKGPVFLSELLEQANVSKSPITTLIKQGYLKEKLLHLDRSSLIEEEYFKTAPKRLNEEQKQGLEKLTMALKQGTFSPFLLWGITGSGKTEIYLQTIEATLREGRGAIMLVPEITLTTQTVEKFKSRFDEKVAVLHHRLSQGERLDTWKKIRAGEIRIVLGARSALFSPVQNLGVIIVDEEHDGAYKQSDSPPLYHAREVAVMRGKITNSVVVLGSATPNLESYTNALQGKYTLIALKNRVAAAKLPTVRIVDMKKASERAKGFTLFSESLLEAIKKRHACGEQVILFLNRRGTHSSMMCHACGTIFQCPHCDVALTFHKKNPTLLCHLCNYHLTPPPSYCLKCGSSKTFKYKGVGTELVERSLNRIFPELRILRIDADTTRHKGSHERLFSAFATGKADVLVGTQMVAKGLHFPSVTLVAILNADGSLHLPDFRASETVFSLVTQVAGRAGRGELEGEVIIQTHLPENPTILAAARQDFEGFYKEEIVSRKCFNYPPFSHLVKFSFSSKNKDRAHQVGKEFKEHLSKTLPLDFALHPVTPAGHPKINDRHRFHFLVRGPGVYPITDAAFPLLQNTALLKGVSITVDVDPLSTFF